MLDAKTGRDVFNRDRINNVKDVVVEQICRELRQIVFVEVIRIVDCLERVGIAVKDDLSSNARGEKQQNKGLKNLSHAIRY